MIVLSVLLFVLGIAVLVTGLMGLTGTLPGNRWVGLRIPEVRKSKDMWVTGHRIAGPFWTGAGVALLLAGLVSLQGGWLWWVVAGVLAIGALALIGIGAANAAHIMAQIDLRKGQEAEQKRAAAGCCSSGNNTPAASSQDAGLVIPPVKDATGTVSAAGDSCGGSCGDCGACDHGDDDLSGTTTSLSAPSLDMDAARRAMAAQDGK